MSDIKLNFLVLLEKLYLKPSLFKGQILCCYPFWQHITTNVLQSSNIVFCLEKAQVVKC